MTDPGCYFHGPEPIPDGAFLVCFECGHCWPTETDFIADVHNLAAEINTEPRNDLPFCPLCSHDF